MLDGLFYNGYVLVTSVLIEQMETLPVIKHQLEALYKSHTNTETQNDGDMNAIATRNSS